MLRHAHDALQRSAPDQAHLDDLIPELRMLHAEMLELETEGLSRAADIHPDYRRSARNLLQYLALRRHDIRRLQGRLSSLGLSSLGRSEAHVQASVEAVLEVLERLSQRDQPDRSDRQPPVRVAESQDLLRKHTEALLGPEPALRRVRIMVTIPSEAADEPALVRALLEHGMDCARINCAHDDANVWERMIAHLRAAARALGKPCRILMDLAGPKLRTGEVEPGARVVKWKPRRDEFGRVTTPARVWLFPQDSTENAPAAADACLPVCRNWLTKLGIGDRIEFIDARGKRRLLRVVGKADNCRWAESVHTAYVVPGTTLSICGREVPGDEMTVRVSDLPAREQSLLLHKGDTLCLTRDLAAGSPARYGRQQKLLAPARIGCTLPEVFDHVRVGERIWLDDGRIGGTIEAVESDQMLVRITHAPARGAKLRRDKGINLPDSSLRLPALTAKDIADLPFVAAHADMVGHSFVRSAADVYELEDRLARVGGDHLGIILKIETQQAFEQLPSLLLAAMRTPCDGVMIARGDLAIECGYERLAEVQEEILWVCEAAHVPVIWATQVLDSLAREGQPSRAEISDAVFGHRAECVMLNKGPHIVQAVRSLADILRRMEAHQSKKHSLLRPLNLARRFFPASGTTGS